MSDVPRKKLCKFKENCKAFLAGNECQFSHEACRFDAKCNKGESCIFYHPSRVKGGSRPDSMERPPLLKPNTMVCRFDGRCAKPLCPFQHLKGKATETFQREPVREFEP